MTFQDIGAGCAPQDHRAKSRLLGSLRQGGRLPAHGRVPGTTSREAGFGESACDSNKPHDLIKGDEAGAWLQQSPPPPLTKGRHGHSTPYPGRSPCGVALLPCRP